MDLIGQLSALGIPADKAQSVAGTVMGFIKQKAPPEVATAIEQKVPEAAQWAGAAPAAAPAASGGLGSLGGMLGNVGSAMGGASGGADLMAKLAGLGIDPGLAAKAMPAVMQFLQSRLGDGVFGKLTAALPMLQQMGGAGGGAAGLMAGAKKLF